MLRRATHKDIPELIEMGKALYDEGNWKSQRFNAAKVSVTIDALINTGFVAVYETNGQIVGMMGGALLESYFSTDYIAIDYCLYVRPEHRGSMAAVRLIDAYVKWATSEGVQVGNILIGVSSGINDDVAVMLCEAMGFKQNGIMMRR